MRVSILGRDDKKIVLLKKILSKYDMKFTTTDPDIVISYGGDGTFLVSERAYPGIPKLLLRDSKICNKCQDVPPIQALELIKSKKYHFETIFKLAARIPGREDELLCTNDFVIRNIIPTHAVRFKLVFDNKPINNNKEFIGDGVVIATPFGSSAYYYSIARKTFDKGIGIAFNNLHAIQPHLVLSEDSRIKIKITRGKAHFVADNDPTIYTLHEGETVYIKKSKHVTRIIDF